MNLAEWGKLYCCYAEGRGFDSLAASWLQQDAYLFAVNLYSSRVLKRKCSSYNAGFFNLKTTNFVATSNQWKSWCTAMILFQKIISKVGEKIPTPTARVPRNPIPPKNLDSAPPWPKPRGSKNCGQSSIMTSDQIQMFATLTSIVVNHTRVTKGKQEATGHQTSVEVHSPRYSEVRRTIWSSFSTTQ